MEVEKSRAEIYLLGKLVNGDEVMEDLWTLWYYEQGVPAGDALREVEERFMGTPKQWPQAEEAMVELIHQYGNTWAEPINRLATLYYLQGRMMESEQLCRVVLSIKPWHFGALSGLVMVYASLHKTDQARQWASRRLPSVAQSSSAATQNPRRTQWVLRATEQANLFLEEKIRQRNTWWGPPDVHSLSASTTTNILKEEESSSIDLSSNNAWQ